MKSNLIYITLIVFFSFHQISAQEEDEGEELKIVTEEVAVKKKKKEKKFKPYEPLAPARAAFYSAILPGLGQLNNGDYWKVPIVYAALGTTIYFYSENSRVYNRLRDVYKKRISGVDAADLDFSDFSDDQLISLQTSFRKDREGFLLGTVAIYLANIIEANVAAHLRQYNISEDLTFKPKLNFNEFNARPSYGVSLNYSF
ncbi:hypothetical protein GCM10022393_00750 [Aquimarina addita]|uniref:DUF5683 domain-containing protein n=1 Tax=Aquimarina addita TaxID=870485 RepID=A0ABP7X9L6_9FLAO